MTVYYKATRPDGTDFYSGRVQYEVGKRVRPLPHEGARFICGPGVLHAADAPGETLIGGRWPCRLFEVTGKPIDGFNARHRHKGAFRQLTVVRELPAWMALGPNGKLVAGVIERTRQITYEEALDLRAAWGAAWAAAGAAARAAARDAARAAAGAAAGDAAWGAAWGAAGDAARAAAGDAARDAAWDAALALLTRDLISAEHFDALYGPWQKVIGDPDE